MRVRASHFPIKSGLFPILLIAMILILWLAGGASRANVAGQIVVRAAAWIALVIAALAGRRVNFGEQRPVLLIMLAALALPVFQLVPLPPGVWHTLPGHQFMNAAGVLVGEGQPWRPLSISPGATANAAASLVVPFAILILLAGSSKSERVWLPGFLLALMAASTLVGLVQFSGSNVHQPLINYTYGVSGTFANRNHFALFLALGCLIAPVWGLSESRHSKVRIPLSFALLMLFILTVLASGSRAGMALAALALIIAPFMVRDQLVRQLRGKSRWALPIALALLFGLVAIFIVVSLTLGRAASIDRLFVQDVALDMRSKGLPVILSMIKEYFPFGIGFGNFDRAFRMNEPFNLLKLTYFNEAHNDYLGIALDGGIVGLAIVAAATLWWLYASFFVWRYAEASRVVTGRLGSAMLLLLFLASVVDYPARTPMMMAMAVIAAYWLAAGQTTAREVRLETDRDKI